MKLQTKRLFTDGATEKDTVCRPGCRQGHCLQTELQTRTLFTGGAKETLFYILNYRFGPCLQAKKLCTLFTDRTADIVNVCRLSYKQ